MTVIDLFSGVGGFSLGFQRAGFKIVAAVEADPKHRSAHKLNFPDCLHLADDVLALDQQVAARLGCAPTVLIGGPPCQGFSVGGKRNAYDPRNELVAGFARAVLLFRPRVFIMENVVGLGGTKYAKVRTGLRQTVQSAGYRVVVDGEPLTASKYGVPQDRKRLFWVGTLEDGSLPWPPAEGKSTTVADAIADLSASGNSLGSSRYRELLGIDSWRSWRRVGDPGVVQLTGMETTNHSAEVTRRFDALLGGERDQISRFLRLDWQGRAPTLRAGTTRKRGAFMAPRPVHPSEPRCITVREAARLHSFPDWFQFASTKWYAHMQIGNSVPPLLAASIASAVRQHLTPTTELPDLAVAPQVALEESKSLEQARR